jgi:hypothetical protein
LRFSKSNITASEANAMCDPYSLTVFLYLTLNQNIGKCIEASDLLFIPTHSVTRSTARFSPDKVNYLGDLSAF